MLGSSDSSHCRNDRLTQKLCFDKLMEDIANLKKDMTEKFRGKQLSKESRPFSYIRQSKELPFCAQAQRDLLLREYVDKLKFVINCTSKNDYHCQLCCNVVQDLVTLKSYALRYRLGKLKKSSVKKVTETCEQSTTTEPQGPNIELRLDCTYCDHEEYPDNSKLGNLLMMAIAEIPNELVEHLDNLKDQHWITKTEHIQMKRMQHIIHAPICTCNCIQREQY